MYWLYINLGCRFEFRTQKLPYERIYGNFSDFIDFGHQVQVCETKSFYIFAVFQNIWDLHEFGLQIWSQNAKITLWKNFGQFFRFHRFWSSGPHMRNKVIFNIRCISKCMGFTFIWVSHLNSERKNFPMEEFRVIFQFSSILVIKPVYAKQGHFSMLPVFQNVWDLHKFGLQIWIHNAKITVWKNFGQFFRFHRFCSSGPRMKNKVISEY